MPFTRFAAILLLVRAAAAQTPLPELKIEPIAGGSVFFIKNVTSQPLTAFVIELVDYPGSSYVLWEDEISSEPVAPGVEKRIAVASMTVGAVPEYVKIQAALYADGTSSGIPAKIAQLIDRRRLTLETTRELIRRIEKAQSSGTPKADLTRELKQWSESIPQPGKSKGNSPARVLISETAARLEAHSLAETLEPLRASERALSASKPNL